MSRTLAGQTYPNPPWSGFREPCISSASVAHWTSWICLNNELPLIAKLFYIYKRQSKWSKHLRMGPK